SLLLGLSTGRTWAAPPPASAPVALTLQSLTGWSARAGKSSSLHFTVRAAKRFETPPQSDQRLGPKARVVVVAVVAVVVIKTNRFLRLFLRGMMDEEGNQFVAYFLPNEATTRKRKRDTDEGIDYMHDDVYEYKISREYNWNVKNKASKGYEENYFFIFRDGDGVYYNELETRVRLSKRRAKGGHGVQSNTNAVLVVKHRDMNEKELEAQVHRSYSPSLPPSLSLSLSSTCSTPTTH
uniref:RNA polymerase II-associated factor 1 homolog n=1 Tax=Callorhinchus milii TaxID=7868 RepID=A0A4W3GNP9_CALMI